MAQPTNFQIFMVMGFIGLVVGAGIVIAIKFIFDLDLHPRAIMGFAIIFGGALAAIVASRRKDTPDDE